MQTTVEIKDGPLAGTVHELNSSLGPELPARLRLRDEKQPTLVHWYRVEGQNGYYETTEYKPLLTKRGTC